jgi:hypothetical protein
MADIKEAAAQLKTSLDKIIQAKNNPEQVQQMVNDAKAKVDQLCKQAEG